MYIVKDILESIEKLAPAHYAEEWDNVGILAGAKEDKVQTIMLALDATEEVIDEAIAKKVDLLITHHPLIFRKMHQINSDTSIGKRLLKLIKNDITLCVAHTNLDSAKGGINDFLCDKLNINNTSVLCSDSVEGDFGIGRIGELDAPTNLLELAQQVKQRLSLDYVRISGKKDTNIRKVAICSGSGMTFISSAIAKKADVYITGDLTHHDALDAVHDGIAVIDAGHFGTEKFVVEVFKDYLSRQFDDINIIVSENLNDIIQTV